MKRKEAVYKGLQYIPVYFEDTSLTSPDYFQITEFPTRLTAGKNLFKLRGNPVNLRVGSRLDIEVLDYNGDPIYSEVVDFIDEDKSRVVAIYVYEDTSPGDCTITLVASANKTLLPTNTTSDLIRWSRTTPVNPNVSNISEIIFEKTPDVTVDEIIGIQLDRTYVDGQFPTYNTGSVRYFSYNNQPALELQAGEFTSDMKTGVITITAPQNAQPTPSYPIATTPFIANIKKVLSPTIALLDQEYVAKSIQTVSPHTYTAFDYSTFSLSYEASPKYIETENSQSFAYIQIKGLSPATGDVSRVKVFTNNKGTIGQWDLVNDLELDETEIFVTTPTSILPDQNIGIFTSQSIIDTYWTASTYQSTNLLAPPTLTWNTASLNNAMQIATPSITERNECAVISTKPAYAGVFISGSSYKITVDALGNTGTVSFYLSGSAFYEDPTDYFNQEFAQTMGKRVGELKTNTNAQRFDDIVLSFEADYTGTATLNIVVESGEWSIADIRTTSDNDAGYTPNYTRIKTPIETTHKINNQLSFKVEYYNVNGEKSRQISYVRNKNWEGGNRYIDGDFSMLTGSLYVADSLNSGVAISGYPNSGFIRSLGYEGFEAGYPGFLLWSGSALPGQNTKYSNLYAGVGLELYLDPTNYFRYSTADNELYVATNNFFFGNPATTFISGSNGNLQISSSGFHLQANGTVTASGFMAVSNGTIMLNTSTGYADGKNIGRHLDYKSGSFTVVGGATTQSIATATNTMIKDGETTLQIIFPFRVGAAAGTRSVLVGISWQTTPYINASGNTVYTSPIWTTVFSTGTPGIAGVTSAEVDLTNPIYNGILGAPVQIRIALNNTAAGGGGSGFTVGDYTLQTARSLGKVVI